MAQTGPLWRGDDAGRPAYDCLVGAQPALGVAAYGAVIVRVSLNLRRREWWRRKSKPDTPNPRGVNA